MINRLIPRLQVLKSRSIRSNLIKTNMRVISMPMYNFSTEAEAKPKCSEKVSALVDDIAKLNLREVADLVAELKSQLNLPDTVAQPQMMMSAAPAAAEIVEEEEPEEIKKIVNLQLDSFDEATKIKVIKEVKTLTGLGLKDAKTLVESAPAVLVENLKREEAEELVKTLEAVGAKSSLV